MRPAQAGSAASRGVREWDQIHWPLVHDRVRRPQTRIAQATRDQDWRRVKALQRFLINSFSAKALAVKRVSENDGKRTPGVDGQIWSTRKPMASHPSVGQPQSSTAAAAPGVHRQA
jgi:RNA-directed DNA polymerase